MATEFYENAYYFTNFSNNDVHSRLNIRNHLNYSKENLSIGRESLDVIRENINNEQENDLNYVEHPLETPWTFWCDRTARGATAEEYINSLKMVKTVDTVEGFFQVHHHLPSVERLAPGVNYHIMRSVRQPMWEDKANINGGTWRFRVPKCDSADIWLELILAAVGEQLRDTVAYGDVIVGVSISIREKDDIIQIWNDNSAMADESTQRVIERVKCLYPDGDHYLDAYYKPNQAHIGYEGTKRR